MSDEFFTDDASSKHSSANVLTERCGVVLSAQVVNEALIELEWLDDLELLAKVKAREHELNIKVALDDL
ncbi:MAG: hypothetical protein PHE17_03725 [Thiothrix sp.]|uniref:hypothetical protein n=1 Tax=Thiothrix sp. TaxID=1032 RepID=UPI00261B2CA0|nr:hypothetical protein [Thiothrix sp.]MDD5392111.1 hypothetical protein [Thiothrix sp.]